MRKIAILALGSSLLGTLVLAAAAWAGSKDNEPTFADNQSTGIVSRLFPDDDKGPPWRLKAKKQKDRLEHSAATKSAPSKRDSNKDETNKPVETVSKEPSKHEKEMADIKREQAAYFRRLAVCDQLRDVALKNNDENLRRQAEELENQASAIYFKQTAHLSVGNQGRAPEENPNIPITVGGFGGLSLPSPTQEKAGAREENP
jgi:hypothetical protein